MHHRESGLALLALLVVMGVLVTLIFLDVQPPVAAEHRSLETERSLQSAKHALIDYAVTYAEHHPAHPLIGLLPCPDEGPTTWTGPEREGVANANCGPQAVSRLGRLPFATLGLAPLRDGAQECLWYAVSGTYKNSPLVSGLFNWDTPGLLRVVSPVTATVVPVTSAAVGDDVVAVVIAPGPALGQNRFTSRVRRSDRPDAPQCGGNYVSANYLEAHPAGLANNQVASPNPNAISTFFESGAAPSFTHAHTTYNDNVAFITRRELWSAIERSRAFRDRMDDLMQTLAACLAHYSSHPSTPTMIGDKRMPWAVDFVQSPPNRYTDNNNFGYADEANHLMGRVPYVFSDSNVDTGRAASPTDLPTACAGSVWNTERALTWRHWKDHFFYALSRDFSPRGVAPVTRCTSIDQCLKINGDGPFAGIVLFAGRALPGQMRSDISRSDVANYLEGRNSSNAPNVLGNSDFESHIGASTTFNDRALCIRPDLSMTEC